MGRGEDCREGVEDLTPTVIVHGIGRCGSSLAMQMLEAGGWPVVGRYPDHEPEEVSPFHQGAVTSRRAHEITVPADWIGRAVKLIWPAAWGWGGGSPAIVVLATRDPLIQAESQVKLMRAMMPGAPIDSSRRKLRQLADANAEDTARARSLVQRAGAPLLEWPFVGVLRDPRRMALRLSSFLHEHCGQGLDVDRAAAMVIPRSPRCYPGLLEAILLAKAQELERLTGPLSAA